MPTSSEGSRHLQQEGQRKSRENPNWKQNLSSKLRLDSKTAKFQSSPQVKTNRKNEKNSPRRKYQANVIRHISPPTSLTSTSANVLQSMSNLHHQEASSTSEHFNHKSTVNLAGQLVRTTGSNKKTTNINNNNNNNNNNGKTSTSSNKLSLGADLIMGAADNEAYVGSRPSLITLNASKGATFNTPFVHSSQGVISNPSLSNQASSSASAANINNISSTTQLNSLAYGESNHNIIINSNHNNNNKTMRNNSNNLRAAPFSIKRKVNLKYIKTIIILLLAIDLLITVFVHQFSSQDYLSIWFTSFKLRFSLLNLILSAIWFSVLIAAILFDIYFILVISFIVDIISFFLLLGFSFVHFYRKIDYNTVNLTSLLLLLFSIIVLHVYLLVLSALTMYLMQAVRRRQLCPTNN